MTMDDKTDAGAAPTRGLPPTQEGSGKNGNLPARGDTSGEMDAAGGGRTPAPEARPDGKPVNPGNVAPRVPSGRPMTPPALAPMPPPAVAPAPGVRPDSGHCNTGPEKQGC